MRGQTESETILLMVNGTLGSVKGVKKRSTCNDVINMVTTGVTTDGQSSDVLAIFESSNGVERLLSPSTNIWKVIRSWGNDTSYSLVLKPTDDMKAKMATASRTKRNLQKLRSVMSFNKTTTTTNDIANNLDNCVKTTKTKSLTEFEAKPDKLCEKKGKLALFHRYISDVLSHRSKSTDATSHNSAFVYAEAECNATDIVVGDVDDTTDYEYLDHEHTDMNMAFIGEAFTDMNTAFIDETLTDSDESHCDILNQHVYTESSITSDESGFGDDSVCSIDELEKNVFDFDLDVTVVHAGWLQEGLTPTDTTVIKHEHIKNIFSECVSNGEFNSLDDSMDSFMNTRVNILEHDDSDDGLSSLGSDMGSV